MKKPITKLTLHRETIKTLNNDDLMRVIGGRADCPDLTRIISGCTTDPRATLARGVTTKLL